MLKTIIGFLVAFVLTYVAGAVFISQGNLAQVAALGLTVDMAVRLEAAVHDVMNMTDIYLPLVGIALLIAFPVAAIVIRFLPDLRLVGFALSGFVAMIALHIILEMVVGVVGIAPTRFIGGLLLQGVAGAVGGVIFHLVTRAQTSEPASS